MDHPVDTEEEDSGYLHENGLLEHSPVKTWNSAWLSYRVKRLIELVDKALQQMLGVQFGLSPYRLVVSNKLWIYFEILLLVGLAKPFFSIAQTPASEEPVKKTSIAKIKEWTKEELSLEPLVEIEGAATYAAAPWSYFFLQEGDHALFVSHSPENPPPSSGDKLRVTGKLRPGSIIPTISEAKMEVIGNSTLPEGKVYPIVYVNSGATDCQWAGIQGVVRTVTAEEGTGRHFLEIISHEQQIRGYVQGSTSEILSEKFLNEKIQFFGTCGSQFDPNQNLIGSHLFTPSVKQYEHPKAYAHSVFLTQTPFCCHLQLRDLGST